MSAENAIVLLVADEPAPVVAGELCDMPAHLREKSAGVAAQEPIDADLLAQFQRAAQSAALNPESMSARQQAAVSGLASGVLGAGLFGNSLFGARSR